MFPRIIQGREKVKANNEWMNQVMALGFLRATCAQALQVLTFTIEGRARKKISVVHCEDDSTTNRNSKGSWKHLRLPDIGSPWRCQRHSASRQSHPLMSFTQAGVHGLPPPALRYQGCTSSSRVCVWEVCTHIALTPGETTAASGRLLPTADIPCSSPWGFIPETVMLSTAIAANAGPREEGSFPCSIARALCIYLLPHEIVGVRCPMTRSSFGWHKRLYIEKEFYCSYNCIPEKKVSVNVLHAFGSFIL